MYRSVDVQTPPVSLTLNHLPFQGRQGHFVPAGHKDGDAYNIIYKLFTHAIIVGRQCRRAITLRTMDKSIGSPPRPVNVCKMVSEW